MGGGALKRGALENEPMIDLMAIARELNYQTTRPLRKLSKQGEFPEILDVTPHKQLVRASDYRAWKANRWTSARVARQNLHADAVLTRIRNPRASN